jgi:hypothetical protein
MNNAKRMEDKSSPENDEASPPTSETKLLFSQEEIESMAKGFILAWVRGQIVIQFPTGEEMYAQSKETFGRQISKNEAVDWEIKNKDNFNDLIEICSGRRPASPDELTTATNALFRKILDWREGERIKGSFLEYSFEERMAELERKLEATNRIVVEFIKWYRGSTSGESVPKM